MLTHPERTRLLLSQTESTLSLCGFVPRNWCHLFYLSVLGELALNICLMESIITSWCEPRERPKASGKLLKPVLNIKPWWRATRRNLTWAEDELGWKGEPSAGSTAWKEASKALSCCLFAFEQEGRAGKMQLPHLADLNQPKLAWGHLQLGYLLSQHTHGAAEGQRIRQGDTENVGLMKWWIVLPPCRCLEIQIIRKWRQNCSSSGKVKEELEVERSLFSVRRLSMAVRAGRCCDLLSPVTEWPELSVSTAWHSAGMASPSSSPSQLRVVQTIPRVAAPFQPLRLRQVCLNLIDYCSTNCIGSSPGWCWVHSVCWRGSCGAQRAALINPWHISVEIGEHCCSARRKRY